MSTIIGPSPGLHSFEMPAPHPAVSRAFVQPDSSAAPIRLFPVNLDVKQAEVARCLLVDRKRSCFVDQWQSSAIPVFISTDPKAEELFCRVRPACSIFLDLHDKGRKFDFLSLTDSMWQTIATDQLQLIYLKLQVHQPANYVQLNRLPSQVHVLSMPLLLGGSRFHITVTEDFAGDCLFSRNLRPNPSPAYEYDWSCIGSPTSDDRKAAFDLLQQQPAKGFLTVSIPGHSDARVATVPMEKYLQISRDSRLCISLNGRGPWCLKDGELFANECFILRQWHPTIDLNPLTPRDGIHWRIFRTENLLQTIAECLANPTDCERIRREGFANFRQAMSNQLWSNCYVECLADFLENPTKAAWNYLSFA